MSKCAWCEKKYLVSAWMTRHAHTRKDPHTNTETGIKNEEPGSRRQGKRETQNACCIQFLASTVRETFGYLHLRLWKNAFYKYRVEYIAEQAIATLTTFCFPLYRIKWWIFACLCRLFPKHSAVGYEAATSTLVLGYYYFLVFLAFVAPKTESTTTTTKANGLFLSEWCSVAFYIHSSSYSKSIPSWRKERKGRKEPTIVCLAISDYSF